MRRILTIAVVILVATGVAAAALAGAHVTRQGARRVAELEGALDAALFSAEKARAEAERTGTELASSEEAVERSRAERKQIEARLEATRDRAKQLRSELSVLRGVKRDLVAAQERLLACEDALFGLSGRGATLGTHDDLVGLLRQAFDAGRAKDWATFRQLRSRASELEERLSSLPPLDSVTRTSLKSCRGR